MEAAAIFSPAGASAYLNHIVSPHTLAHHRMLGLPPKWSKTGGKIIYRKEHLDEWVADGEQPLAVPPNPSSNRVDDAPVALTALPKRKRGRPPKIVVAPADAPKAAVAIQPATADEPEAPLTLPPAPKRPRGRPRKHPTQVAPPADPHTRA